MKSHRENWKKSDKHRKIRATVDTNFDIKFLDTETIKSNS